jgi:antitoxin YefM
MDKNNSTYSASEARKNLYKLVDRVQETHEPIYITGKRNSAYLISEEDWRAIQETLYLESIPGVRKAILEGLKTPVEEMNEVPDW